MSSSKSDNPRQRQPEVDASPPAGVTSPLDDYLRDQRIRCFHAHDRIFAGVLRFCTLHVVIFVVGFAGVGIAARFESDLMAWINVIVFGVGWLIAMGVAVHVARIAFANWRQLHWTWLLLAGFPWAVVSLEAIIAALIVLAMLTSF